MMDFTVKLTDALLGKEADVETLDGKIKVKIPESINHGEILRVRGRGVPIGGNRRGDLMIRVKVEIPSRLSRKAKELIDELKKEGL